MNFVGYIYIIENKSNGKLYIGQTVDPARRHYQHLDRADGSSPLLHNAIKKYGKESFDFVVLEQCYSQEELNIREMFWIQNLSSKHPSGYNMDDGGTGGNRTFSEEHREKLREAKLGELNPNYARPSTVLNIDWMREGGEHPWVGRSHSEKTKRKIANTIRNKIHCKRGHKFTLDNTYINRKTGKKLCRECHRIRGRRFYHDRKGRLDG